MSVKTVRILGLLTNDNLVPELKHALGGKPGNNEADFFCDYSEYEIPVGHVFKSMLNQQEELVYQGGIVLKSCTQQFGKPFESIPLAWKKICRFSFLSGVPSDVIDSLPAPNSWDMTAHYFIVS